MNKLLKKIRKSKVLGYSMKKNLKNSNIVYVYIFCVLLISSCQGTYSNDDLFFIKPFHDRDTLLFKSITGDKQDTLYVSKHVDKSVGWNPLFKDGLFYYNSILISIDWQSSNNYYDNILLRISKEKSQLTSYLDFGGLGKSIYNTEICCKLDTMICLKSGQKIKQVYKITNDIDYDGITNLNYLVDTIWWNENYGIIMFSRRNGEKWLRFLNQVH